MMTDNRAQPSLSRLLFRAGAAQPFLRESIEGMERIPDPAVNVMATDGTHIFLEPDGPLEEATVGHLLTHCLFRHLVVREGAIRPLWDLACDVAAEFLRTELFGGDDAAFIRRQIAEALPDGVDPRIAGAVYRALTDFFEDELEPLYARFQRDDHRYWYAPAPGLTSLGDFPRANVSGGEEGGQERRDGATGGPAHREGDGGDYRECLRKALANHWPSPDELPGGTTMTGRYGLSPGCREERMLLRQAAKYDFSRYLRRFSTMREELRLDLGDFDYIPYCYGLSRYGNLPLVEPLEYVESHKVEELVIAIDTSGSCTRPIVERFLAEIEGILMRHDYFFSRMNVHVIQCDSIVQSHVAIHSMEAWRRYTRELVIRGRGGTNFTPVFTLVEALIRRGELKNLKGLLYFTDGDGVYPQRRTPYETAFVFTTRKALSYNIPEWIVPLCLERAQGA